MPTYPFVTVDVFTDTRFGGNPLAVFPDAQGLSDAEMKALAAEMNLSETSFVLPADDPANTARVRIFNRTAEMPFAGHPNVGTGFVLARLGAAGGDTVRFEEAAGLVDVRVERSPNGDVVGAEIDAPQPLQWLEQLPVDVVAACIGVSEEHVLTGTHPPVRATVGVAFVLVEVAGDALLGAAPDIVAFRRAAGRGFGPDQRLSIFLYARDSDVIRCRMFAPLSGTWEDPATGSASATLGALLLSHSDQREARYRLLQGVEMGRPSQLRVSARRTAEGIRASVGGNCVPVLRGEAQL